MNNRTAEGRSIYATNSKSSANYISSLIQKNPSATHLRKQKINYQKVLKPSIKAFSKHFMTNDHIKTQKTPIFDFSETSTSSDVVVREDEEITCEDALKRLIESYEEYKQTPFMLIKNNYKQQKKDILKELERSKIETERKIEEIGLENIRLKEQVEKIEEWKAEQALNPEAKRDALRKHVQIMLTKESENTCQAEMAEEIVAEFSNFKTIKTHKALEKVQQQINQFFNIGELQCFFPEIITTLSRKVLDEMSKKQKMIFQSQQIHKQYETLRQYETRATMSSFY